MALSKEKKQEIIAKFAKDPNDTGSVEVQVALLTARIDQLTPSILRSIKKIFIPGGGFTFWWVGAAGSSGTSRKRIRPATADLSKL
jgi:hypothetical protein